MSDSESIGTTYTGVRDKSDMRLGAERLEATRANADYWLNGGREEPDRARSIMAIEQAINAWKNAAYGLSEELTRQTARLRSTEDQLIAVAKRLNAECGDDGFSGGDSLAASCIRKIDRQTALAKELERDALRWQMLHEHVVVRFQHDEMVDFYLDPEVPAAEHHKAALLSEVDAAIAALQSAGSVKP